MKILVAGATGRTGRRIVNQLCQQNIEVRALVRDRAKAQGLFPNEVEIVTGDVTEPKSLSEIWGGITGVICATGASPSLNPLEPFFVDYRGTINLYESAKAHSVRRFVLVTSLCVSQFFHPLNLFWLILFWKRQAEMDLVKSGLTYTIVRPGGLKEANDEQPILMSEADSRFEGSIPREKVAEVCVQSLLNETANNKIIEIVTAPEGSTESWEKRFAAVAAS
ncbi:MAG: SDR family oxidoreductase [Cyanobacteria bacterium P01_H01_bin.15]